MCLRLCIVGCDTGMGIVVLGSTRCAMSRVVFWGYSVRIRCFPLVVL